MAIKKVRMIKYQAKCDGCKKVQPYKADDSFGAFVVATSLHGWKPLLKKLYCAECSVKRKIVY